MRRSLQLDHVALRVVQIDRRTFAPRAVTRTQFADAHVMRLEVLQDRGLVIVFHPQAQVIHVVSFLTGRRATVAAKLAVDGHQVDQRRAGAQLHQSNPLLPPFFVAAQHVALKALHRFHVDGTQDYVVNFTDTNHGITHQAESG